MSRIKWSIAHIFIVVLFIGFTSEKSRGQDYKPFIEANKYWDVSYYLAFEQCEEVYRYFFSADTIINDLVYYQIAYYRGGIGPPPDCAIMGFGNVAYHLPLLFREDTIKQEVYQWVGVDELWFEFNNQAGDSVIYAACGYNEFPRLPIIEVDTNYIYGFTRRIFNCEFDDGMDLIEGIGYMGSSGFDPFQGYCPLVPTGRILCVSYGNAEDAACGNPTSSREILDSKIEVYPNPVIDRLIIAGVDRDAFVKVYNSYGQLVESFLIQGDHEMDVINYLPGIYLVQISDHKGRLMAIKKVLKTPST